LRGRKRQICKKHFKIINIIAHSNISDSDLRQKIRQKAICFGGNKNLKIYGKLNCATGKRMLRKNRIFFASSVEAIESGFRPCGHCLKNDYKKWKDAAI
jgi:methylphosphotriester-DNA--protein-cysteine methyltransferase